MKRKKAATRSGAVSTPIVGRVRELARLRACVAAGRNVLLEGPVGVGKTQLATEVTRQAGRPVIRIDGDSRYSEQKLTGWFDPPTVMKKGYVASAFVPGPLVEAMEAGGVLFINELNRLPESVQNVLLPAIDERKVSVPRMGEIRARPGFLVVATQNPKEYVATSHLSEAILDRFELLTIDYQSEAEEIEIVMGSLPAALAAASTPEVRSALAAGAVRVVNQTRNHPEVRRGASVRAAQAIASLGLAFMADGWTMPEALADAVLLALPTRVEWNHESGADGSRQEDMQRLLKEWVDKALSAQGQKSPEKKK